MAVIAIAPRISGYSKLFFAPRLVADLSCLGILARSYIVTLPTLKQHVVELDNLYEVVC